MGRARRAVVMGCASDMNDGLEIAVVEVPPALAAMLDEVERAAFARALGGLEASVKRESSAEKRTALRRSTYQALHARLANAAMPSDRRIEAMAKLRRHITSHGSAATDAAEVREALSRNVHRAAAR